MESDGVFDDPVRRRWWILTKALESVPIEEALRLARTVEDFLLAPNGIGASHTVGDPRRSLEVAAVHHTNAFPLAAPVNRTPFGEEGATAATIEDAASTGAARGEAGPDAASEAATDADDLLDEAAISASLSDDLVVLAFADDIVRYLRQRDDVVVRDGDTYLVNGRFRENFSQLTERANRMRARQGLPLFQSMPTGFAPAGSNETANDGWVSV